MVKKKTKIKISEKQTRTTRRRVCHCIGGSKPVVRFSWLTVCRVFERRENRTLFGAVPAVRDIPNLSRFGAWIRPRFWVYRPGALVSVCYYISWAPVCRSFARAVNPQTFENVARNRPTEITTETLYIYTFYIYIIYNISIYKRARTMYRVGRRTRVRIIVMITTIMRLSKTKIGRVFPVLLVDRPLPNKRSWLRRTSHKLHYYCVGRVKKTNWSRSKTGSSWKLLLTRR